MRTLSTAAQNALASGDVMEAGALSIMTATPLGFWGGYGDLLLGGVTHTGLGDTMMLQETGGALGGEEQGAEVVLSGVDPATDVLRTLAGLRGAPVIGWRLIFNATGSTLLDSEVRARGRLDQMPGEETSGGEAVLRLKIEGAARGAGRRGGRMRTDADQRLISGTDGGMKRISHAGDVTLYWGGQRPVRAGTVLPPPDGSGLSAVLGRLAWQVRGETVL